MPHTKGPWIIRDRTVGDPPRRVAIEINAPIGVGRMEHPICRIPSGFTNQDDDARLISSAPDLIEALVLLYEETADYIRINHLGDVHHNVSMQKTRDAIAKAIGEPPS